MSDLARQAAEDIVKLFLVRWDGDDVGDAASTIRLHGVLVSHEDAELLRHVKRMAAAITASELNLGFIDFIGYTMDGTQWKVAYNGAAKETAVGRGDTITDALKSALDAAGVPDEKGAE